MLCRRILSDLRRRTPILQSIANLKDNLRIARCFSDYPNPEVRVPEPCPNWDFLLDPANTDRIRTNISRRKGIGDIDKVLELAEAHNDRNNAELLNEVVKIPNVSHPKVFDMGEDPLVIKSTEWTNRLEKAPRSFENISKIVAGCRHENLSAFSGERTYYFTGQLAELEQALVRFAVDRLLKHEGFRLVSVPDILHPKIIEGMGMGIAEDRNQVYRLDDVYGPAALSGTAEMALGGYFMNRRDPQPVKVAAVSRCYRAESGGGVQEKGIYRVHQFTKVEMFAVTEGRVEVSDAMLEDFLRIQDSMYTDLGLAFQVLDMPPHELGAPAYRKFDIEALMPGRKSADGGQVYGEISSCSNCTDYQSRRLNIRSADGFCHTVNGTACAVPRMMIAICEQFQLDNGCVEIPKVLQKYMRNAVLIEPKGRKARPIFKFVKSPKYFQEHQ